MVFDGWRDDGAFDGGGGVDVTAQGSYAVAEYLAAHVPKARGGVGDAACFQLFHDIEDHDWLDAGQGQGPELGEAV